MDVFLNFYKTVFFPLTCMLSIPIYLKSALRHTFHAEQAVLFLQKRIEEFSFAVVVLFIFKTFQYFFALYVS